MRKERSRPGNTFRRRDPALVELAVRHHAGDAWRTEAADTLRADFDGERVGAPVAILVDRTTAPAAENLLLRIPEESRREGPTSVGAAPPRETPAQRRRSGRGSGR